MERDISKTKVIIVSPSLDPKVNVSGISSVVNFIISNNKRVEYSHFLQGRGDKEKDGLVHRIKRVLTNYYRWKRFLKLHNSDLIHYNISMDNNSILRDVPFILYAYRHKRRIIAHIHGGKYLFENKRPFIVRTFLKKLFSLPISFVVLSNKEKEAIYTEFKPEYLYVLPNAIDLTDAFRFHREVNDKQLDILFLGRITKDKGVDFILSSCKILKNEGLKYKLHIAGRESSICHYVQNFKESLGENYFIYEGVVFGEAKEKLLKKCNIFLMPSFYEGLPMSLLESMSYGEIPIVTNVGSIGDVIRDNKNGLIVEIKNEQAIVQAIKKLYNNRELLEKLSCNAKDTIFLMFNPKDYIKALNNMYINTPPTEKR